MRPARRRWTPSGLMRTSVRSRSAIGQGLRGARGRRGWVGGSGAVRGGRSRRRVAHARADGAGRGDRQASSFGASGGFVGACASGFAAVDFAAAGFAGASFDGAGLSASGGGGTAFGPSGGSADGCAGTTDEGRTGSSSSTTGAGLGRSSARDPVPAPDPPLPAALPA